MIIFLIAILVLASTIATILTLFIILLFFIPLKMDFVFDTDSSKLQLTGLWLHPFIMALITLENRIPVLNLSVFGKQILKKKIMKKTGTPHSIDYIRAIDPEDIQISARYGFRNPFDTGITCGAVNLVSQIINISFFENTPDFLAENDYIYLNVSANIFIGPAITRIIKHRLSRRDLQWIRT
ncbi:MAG TPA: hypothetical protein VHP38_07455 [Ruminiclostridium sp.]|nr:hypothetical protein [Ruminiclostridium sp.]